MLPQNKMIKRLQHICENDSRLVAAMLYGSFAKGEADKFSDIDCMLFFDDAEVAQIDQRTWVSQIAPVELYYVNEFGNGVAIFDNMVRAEFHFDPASDIPQLEKWRGMVWFPSLDTALLVDHTDELAKHLEKLVGAAPTHDNAEDAEYLCHSFLNWMLFGSNVFERGEHVRAHELLTIIHDYLLRMVRLLEGNVQHWIAPAKALEDEISTAAYKRFAACTSAVLPEQLEKAYRATWEWGAELMAVLAERYSLELPTSLLDKLGARLLGSA